MNISIPGEAVGASRDALILWIYQAEMDAGRYAGRVDGYTAERLLVVLKHAIHSLPESGAEMPASVSVSSEVAAIIKTALLAYIIKAEMDVKSSGLWTKERGVAKTRERDGGRALHHLTWAISKAKGEF